MLYKLRDGLVTIHDMLRSRLLRLIAHKRNKWLVPLIVLYFFVLVLTGFSGTSYCDRCGKGQHEIHLFLIPFTEIQIFQWHWEFQTPVERTIQSQHLVSSHEHNWVFCYGSGNGTSCAIGDARHFAGALESEEMANVIELMTRQHEAEFRDELIKRLFEHGPLNSAIEATTLNSLPSLSIGAEPSAQEIQTYIKEVRSEWDYLDSIRRPASP